MIRLTNIVHEAEWVAPEKIIRIRKATEESVPRTRVYLQDGSYVVVTETPQEVSRKVLEWRLAMTRYAAAYAEMIRSDNQAYADFGLEQAILEELSGLGGTEP